MNLYFQIKSLSIFLAIGLLFSLTSFSQEVEEDLYNESCTSIMLGKKATDDGSVITAHTCDAWYRTWLDFVPAQKFDKDTTVEIYWGTMHTSTAWSKENLILKDYSFFY